MGKQVTRFEAGIILIMDIFALACGLTSIVLWIVFGRQAC
jgi:hypothetical protein